MTTGKCTFKESLGSGKTFCKYNHPLEMQTGEGEIDTPEANGFGFIKADTGKTCNGG